MIGLLGHSYTEIAGMSRSMHRSQGMGTAERRGPDKNYIVTVAGEPAKHDIFDGIDISWNRITGGSGIGQVLAEAARTFRPEQPEATVPLLVKARKLMAGMEQPIVDRKRRELDETIALCSGVWLDATADKFAVVPGGSLKVKATALEPRARSRSGGVGPDRGHRIRARPRTPTNKTPNSRRSALQ